MDVDTAGGSHADIYELAALEAVGRFDLAVARRTVRVSALVAGIVLYLFALLYVIGGPAAFIPPNVIAGTALVVVALLPFRSPKVQLYLGVSIGLGVLASHVILLGRIDTGSTVWFLVPAVVATLVGARRVALYCAVVTVTVLIGVPVAAGLGLPLVGSVTLPNPELVMGLSMVGALVATAAVANVAVRARRALMADVEARTVDLAAALQEARAARAVAVDAAEAKERFFANLTHEIRTPLNGIAGTAELLNAADLPPDERSMATALLASTRNLVTLVNTMLAHARLRAGRVDVDLAPVRVRDLASDVEALFRAQAADKGIALEVRVEDDCPDWVETDGVKAGQVIANLVGNAVKFTDRGRIDVSFRYWTPPGADALGRLEVTVADTGIGISETAAATVFEPFVQGDASMTRAHGGTGLGLAIANQLAGLLGGSLTLSSHPGAGSTFRLEVPAAIVAAPPVPEPVLPETQGLPVTPVRPGSPRMRVLLAEDNDVNRLVASRMLEMLGAEVLLAEDGHGAVRQAAATHVDLILMDLQMPGLDGIAAAREIRRREAEAGTPRAVILAMTGNAREDYGDACATAGMDGFITKPAELAQLRGLLERMAVESGGRPGAPADIVTVG